MESRFMPNFIGFFSIPSWTSTATNRWIGDRKLDAPEAPAKAENLPD
jgi:hypothetical protein